MIPILTSNRIILKPLSENDSEAFYALYADSGVQQYFDESPFLPGEQPLDFTNRIIAVCNYLWTVRTIENPDTIIGDCALHHYDEALKRIEIGGSLLPAYWGKGLMAEAIDAAIQFAKEELQVSHILTKTKPANLKAISLVKKMGFETVFQDGNEILFEKEA